MTSSVIKRTDCAILCSIFKDGLFHKANSKWIKTIFEFNTDGFLTLFHTSMFGNSLNHYHTFNIANVTLQKIEIDQDVDDSFKGHIGIKFKCKDISNYDTFFRIIFPNDILADEFLNLIVQSSSNNNIAEFRQTMSTNRITEKEQVSGFKISIMRRGIKRAMNKVEKRSVVEIIESR